MIVTTGGVMKSDQHPTRRSVIHTAFVSGAAIDIRSFAQVRHQVDGTAAGEERDLSGIRFCWCPAGHFLMGSPRNEPERRPGEDQVEVKLSRGFWTAKHETTQSQWNRIVGGLPGPLTAELPAGDDLPVGNVNFVEAEEFCRKLTDRCHQSRELSSDWEFSSSHRGTVGIRVSCGNHDRDRIWRSAQQ